MRITQEVNQMPVGFPINSILAILDYDFIKVADNEFVLPLKASTIARMSKQLFKNDVEFGTTIGSEPRPLSRLRPDPSQRRSTEGTARKALTRAGYFGATSKLRYF